MSAITLLTPINYARPKSVYEEVLSKLSNYFYLGGKQAVVIKKDEVRLENGKLEWYTIALKVASYILLAPITLILLAIDLILHSQHRFTLITPSNLEPKKEVEHQLSLGSNNDAASTQQSTQATSLNIHESMSSSVVLSDRPLPNIDFIPATQNSTQTPSIPTLGSIPGTTQNSTEPSVAEIVNPVENMRERNIATEPRLIIATDGSLIKTAHSLFEESGSRDLSQLSQASKSLENLVGVSRQLWREGDYENAQLLDKDIEQYTEWVQEMNMKAPGLTVQDMRGVESFFEPPRQEFYIDKQTMEKFYQPDSSGLLAFGGSFRTEGEYQGVGLSKNMRYPKGCQLPCDVLYVKKQDDQIAYESELYNISQTENWWSRLWMEKTQVVQRMKKQAKYQTEAIDFFEQKILEWNYSSFKFCGYEELIALGFQPERAVRIHAVVLYHKKWDKED